MHFEIRTKDCFEMNSRKYFAMKSGKYIKERKKFTKFCNEFLSSFLERCSKQFEPNINVAKKQFF